MKQPSFEIDAEFVPGEGPGLGSHYSLFPDTVRNFEADILRDLRRGWDVSIEWRKPVRVGPLMLAPDLAGRMRRFLGSVSRPNPARKRRGK